MRFQAVLFDLDGTLIDTGKDIASGVNAALALYGLGPLAFEAVIRHVGRGARVLMSDCLTEECGVPVDRVGGLDRAVRDFRALYAERLLDTTRPFPGIPEMLDRLAAAGFEMAVVSNKPEDLSRRILDGLGLSLRFGAVLGGETLPFRKPDPAPLLHAIERLGAQRDRTAMVGDSLIDISAAHAAAIPIGVVTWGFVPEDLLVAAAPDHVSRDPADLEGWLTQEG